jgi:hypothetical protein
MSSPVTRRDFVTTSLTAGALAGLGDFAFLGQLPSVSADDTKVTPAAVQFSPDIEPLVRLIEQTPREKLIAAAADKVKAGTNYQQLLSAALLAGVRNIRPRPVGFEFHCVLVVHSAHQAALAAPDRERWLPLFWALDNFKASQATKRVTKKDDWVLPALDDAKLPAAAHAKARFVEAMDAWDEEGADRAVAALTRAAGMGEAFELFARYGARDFRSIGHKAIYVANAFRTLNTIGWRHAEPVLRSLAYALLIHDGTNPTKGDLEPDRPWRENLKRAAKLRADWQRGKVDPQATADLLAVTRKGNWSDSSAAAAELLNKGVDPASVWDGLHLTAGELLMRQPGIVGLHCVTTANAMYYLYAASGNDETRRMLLLQTAAFLAMFRQAMGSRGQVREDIRIDTLEKADFKATGAEAVAEVFAAVRRNRDNVPAARKALALLAADPAAGPALVAAGQRLVFNKGRDSHDYKFSSAVLEDYHHVTPHWRPRHLMSSLFWLHGSGDPDNQLIERAREALAKA